MEKHFFKRIKKKVNACISPDKRHTSVASVVINSLDNSLSYKHICFLKTNPLQHWYSYQASVILGIHCHRDVSEGVFKQKFTSVNVKMCKHICEVKCALKKVKYKTFNLLNYSYYPELICAFLLTFLRLNMEYSNVV